MEGRRLDFDYKKKRQGKVTEDEIKQALEKFDDSMEIAEQSMFNLLESDVRIIRFIAFSSNTARASTVLHCLLLLWPATTTIPIALLSSSNHHSFTKWTETWLQWKGWQ